MVKFKLTTMVVSKTAKVHLVTSMTTVLIKDRTTEKLVWVDI